MSSPKLMHFHCVYFAGISCCQPSKRKCTHLKTICSFNPKEKHHMPNTTWSQQSFGPNSWEAKDSCLWYQECNHLGKSLYNSISWYQSCNFHHQKWRETDQRACYWWSLVSQHIQHVYLLPLSHVQITWKHRLINYFKLFKWEV